MHMFRTDWLLLRAFAGTALLAMAVCAAPALTVAPTGDDQANGGPQAPLRTLGGALRRARELRKQGDVGEIRIELRSGEYQLTEPLVLTPADSELTFAAAAGAKPVVSGGRVVSGWRKWRKGVWQAPLPEGAGGGQTPIRQLFYGGKAQPRSGHPNPLPGNRRYTGWLFVGASASENDRGSFTADLRGIPAVAQLQHVGIDIRSLDGWSSRAVGLAAMAPATGHVELLKEASFPLSAGTRFRLENAPEWIDRPGEWAVDPAARLVYLRVKSGLFGGGKPTKRVVVPALSSLVELQGAAGQPVRRVAFVGVEFTCSLAGSAVVLDTVRNCRFDSCTFRDLGGTAIEFHNANRGNVISKCTFSRLGAAGITMFPGVTGHCTDNVLTHNYFHDLGLVDPQAAAIAAGKSNGNLVAHNLIHHMPRSAISFRLGFGRNVVEWNEIRWTNLETNGAGAIESSQWEPSHGAEYGRGNVIRYNLIADVVGCKALPGRGLVAPPDTWGIHLGALSSRHEVVGNLAVRTMRGGIGLDGGWENLCQYNICVDGAVSAAYYDNTAGRMRGNRVLNSILYNSKGRPRIHLGGHTSELLETHDFNLFWPQPTVSGLPAADEGEDWRVWRAQGHDANSQVTAPIFVAPDADDYRLRAGSPALRLGFRQTDFGEVGLRGTSMWSASVRTAALRPVALPAPVVPAPFVAAVPAVPVPVVPPPVVAAVPVVTPPVAPPVVAPPVVVPPVVAVVPPAVVPPVVAAPLPGTKKAIPGPLHVITPSAPSFVNTGGVNVDGLPLAVEWPGLYSADRLVIAENAGYGGRAGSHAFASVMHDKQHVLVAVDVPVAGGPILPPDGKPRWGRDDGVELCLRAVTRSDKAGPVFVVRGYPSGALVSSAVAGASTSAAEAVGAGTRFAAIRTKSGWSAEFAVPIGKLGIPTGKIQYLRLNLGVRKARTDESLAWVGTQAENWRVDKAGIVRLKPALAKGVEQLLRNGGFEEPSGRAPRDWSTFGDMTDPRGEGTVSLSPDGLAGSTCLRLDAKAPPVRGVGAMQAVTTPAAGTYILGLQVRAEDLLAGEEGGMLVSVRHIPIGGRGRLRTKTHQRVVTHLCTLWERVELPLEIPADTALMTVTVQLRNATGTVWLDQVSLRRAVTD
ncbi:MAG: hypothetical protein HN380_01110 [Victivallales bacterium]|nr:hypothetical protein [Victivallales bacterium]